MFAVLLLAAFAAGMVANAANATSMSLTMSSIQMTDADMGDCCPAGDQDTLACDAPCMVPLLAIAPAARVEFPAFTTEVADPAVKEPAGRTGPPQPHPPRTVILS